MQSHTVVVQYYCIVLGLLQESKIRFSCTCMSSLRYQRYFFYTAWLTLPLVCSRQKYTLYLPSIILGSVIFLQIHPCVHWWARLFCDCTHLHGVAAPLLLLLMADSLWWHPRPFSYSTSSSTSIFYPPTALPMSKPHWAQWNLFLSQHA